MLQLTTGAVSIAGNLVSMALLTGTAGMNPVLANLAAIALWRSSTVWFAIVGFWGQLLSPVRVSLKALCRKNRGYKRQTLLGGSCARLNSGRRI